MGVARLLLLALQWCLCAAGLALPAPGDADTVLFVLHDAGESFALLPAADELCARGGASPAVRLLPLGEPATSIVLCRGAYAQGCRRRPAFTLAELGIDEVPPGEGAGRGQLLSAGSLQKIVDLLAPQVSMVISGMGYAMQLQVGAALRGHGARFLAYFDGLNVMGTGAGEPPSLAQRFAQEADEVWLPSLLQRPEGAGWGGGNTIWRAVGQPSLESWARVARDDAAELRAVRASIYGPAAVASGSPAVCWFGGYGAGYVEALRTWCRAVKQLHAAEPGILFSLAVHPGPYGDEDRRVLREEEVEHLVGLVPQGIRSTDAALVSNLTASQGSTGGIQSLYVGKSAIYVEPDRGHPSGVNLGVSLGLIPEVSSAGAAVDAVLEVAAANWRFDTRRVAVMGMPQQASVVIADALSATFFFFAK